jgi:hypothetical protein
VNIDRPHEIVRDPVPFRRSPQSELPREARKWLPITEAEAQKLEAMDEDGRARWLAALPFTERLRRFAAAEAAEEKP